MLKKVLNRVREGLDILEGKEKVLIETGFSADIIEKLEQVNNENLAEQVKQLTKAVWQMSNRCKEQTEQLNGLTCAIQELQNEQEESMPKKQPFDKDPKVQELFKVNQAWLQGNKKHGKAKFD